MSKTIVGGFSEFLASLTPSDAEVTAASSHRQSLYDCLHSNFGITGFFRTGSFGNGTSVAGYSDVDYFAVTPNDKLRANSATTLQDFRDVLAKRFPNTGVRVSCPAVKVPFNNGTEHTEVLPVEYLSSTSISNSISTYDIPDCENGWMKSSPDSHNNYVDEVNKNLGYKLKPLIRYIKAWKFYNNVKVSSFYLEMRVAKWASTESTIDYPYDIRDLLKWLYENKFAKLQDPTGISGYISPTFSDNQLEDAVRKAKADYDRAADAVSYQTQEKIEKAFERWDMIYVHRFPKYG